MAELFQGLITDEGINQARFVSGEPSNSSDSGWFITPYKFSIAEEKGDFDKSRSLASKNETWLEGYFTRIEKYQNNKLLLTVTIKGDADDVQRRIGEIYITAKTKNAVGEDENNPIQEYLFCLTQAIDDSLVFRPGVALEFSLYISLNNEGVKDIYTIEYHSSEDFMWYQKLEEKGQPDGYCPLDFNTRVPLENMPPLALNRYPATCTQGSLKASDGSADLFIANTSSVKFKVSDIGGTYTPLDVIFPDGTAKRFTSIAKCNMTGKPSGTYNLYLKSDGTPVALANTYYASRFQPGGGTTNTYWVTKTRYVTSEKSWVRPNITSNGVLGGSSFAVADNRSTVRPAWKCFDGTTDTNRVDSVSSTNPAIITVYNPDPLKVQQIVLRKYANGKIYSPKECHVDYSDDGSTWTQLTSYSNSSGAQVTTLDVNSSAFHKFWRIYITSVVPYVADGGYWYTLSIGEIEISATQQVTVEETYQEKVTETTGSTLHTDDIWLDTSTKPYAMYKYTGSEFETINWVKLPLQISWNGSTVSLLNTKKHYYNTNGWDGEINPDIAVTHGINTQVGDSTHPVYINSSGVATTCSAYGDFATKNLCTTRPTTSTQATSDKPAVVVKNYYNSSGHTWYRIWSDKFCEQGGGYITYNDTNRNVGLLVEYPDTSYVISCEHETDSSSYSGSDITVLQKTASSFRVYSAGATHVAFSWYAAGYLASNYSI